MPIKIKNKSDIHFLPSPFKVVTEYEDEFIKQFNQNLSGAVNEVLKYIADKTKEEIKETGNDIQH